MRGNITTACTRPPTRQISCPAKDAGRRVMPGVRLLEASEETLCGYSS